MGILKVKGNIGAATGKHFFLPGLSVESRYNCEIHSAPKRLKKRAP